MDLNRNLEVLKCLSNGVCPVSGEKFPPDSPYHHPDVIRALFFVIDYIRNQSIQKKKNLEEKQFENILKGKPGNAGLPWSSRDRTAIAEQYNDETPLYELAEKFQRSQGAIRSELIRQGLIEDGQHNRL